MHRTARIHGLNPSLKTSTLIEQGEGKMREITYAEAVREAMTLEMHRDENVYLLGEDIAIHGGAYGVTAGMYEEFGPERIRQTPISEAAIIGCAAGSAATGMRPVCEIMSCDFITVGMDQLVNQAAKMRYMFGGALKVPMVVRAPEGSGGGAAAHHSQCTEAWFCNVPGLKVVTASTAADAKGLLTAAIRDNNPVLFLEQKMLYRVKGEVPEGEYVVPLGKARIHREGSDVTIITYGSMLSRSLEAAEQAEKEKGISVEVIDPRTLVPLDKEALIASAKKTGRVLICHEACQTGGYGGELAAVIADSEAFYYLDAPVKRCCGLDVPIPYSPELERNAIPTKEKILEGIYELADVPVR